jgi:hypothetical protein
MYGALGFTLIETDEAGATRWLLPLENFQPKRVPIRMNVLHEAVA